MKFCKHTTYHNLTLAWENCKITKLLKIPHTDRWKPLCMLSIPCHAMFFKYFEKLQELQKGTNTYTMVKHCRYKRLASTRQPAGAPSALQTGDCHCHDKYKSPLSSISNNATPPLHHNLFFSRPGSPLVCTLCNLYYDLF